MTPTQCGAIYSRITADATAPYYIRCTYISGHETRHSWETLKQSDEAVADEDVHVPPAIRRTLQAVQKGDWDPYLEILLTYAHGRKLALRGARGFSATPPQ